MNRKTMYQKVCRQYGLQLVVEAPARWKVVDPSAPSAGKSLTASTFPPYVRGFIDGYVEALQQLRGEDPSADI